MSVIRASRNPPKRQHVIETAYALFSRDGFHATGIDRIIADARVAKMTMYRNFPSKDDLIVVVLEERFRLFEEQLERMAAASDSAADAIDALVGWYGRWFARPDFHGCLFIHALSEFGTPAHPAFQVVVKQKQSLKQRMRAMLAPLMDDASAERTATAILMLLEGATVMAEIGQGEAAMDAARKAVSDIIAARCSA